MIEHLEQYALANHLVQQLHHRVTGRSTTEVTQNFPRDVLFVGNLRPDDEADQSAHPLGQELLNKLAPMAFGAEFRIEPRLGSWLTATLSWACYYRVFPTFEQQKNYAAGAGYVAPEAPEESEITPSLIADDGGEEGKEAASGNASDGPPAASTSTANRKRRRAPTDVLMLRFRKIACTAAGDILLAKSDLGAWHCDASGLLQAISSELERARSIADSDPDAVRTSEDPYANIPVPSDALARAEAFDRLKVSFTNRVQPSWRIDVDCTLRMEGREHEPWILSIKFVNRSSERRNAKGRTHPSIEPFLFDTECKIKFSECAVLPFQVELAPRGFRYDRSIPARSFNCGVDLQPDGTFQLQHTPRFDQQRYRTKSTPSARFADLADDPSPVLASIGQAMSNYQSEWQAQESRFEQQLPAWVEKYADEFRGDLLQFQNELARFEAGRQLVENDPNVRLAFRLTNETFRRLGMRSKKVEWRLFQLVFLVSQLSGIASLAETPGSNAADLDDVDIIYFPTGGGKTEAYLSVVVFHCFFDRLRGKTAGVTAWTRFPLRLLTLQQTQRLVDVIGIAELVRKQHDDPRLSGNGVAGFGVGYFVGKTSTPNELVNPDGYRWAEADHKANWAAAQDAGVRQGWKRLIRCPSCWTSKIQVDLDTTHVRLIHRCTEPSCEFPEGRIPLYIVDNEIYRYLPSVLVGTIDKLAAVGNQRKVSLLLGLVDGYCKQHGYYKGKCCQRECNGKSLVARVPSGLTGPTLFVQDELHLLKEGLGTFDGHYETFTRQLLNEIKPGSKLKIIASSATIENFARQVEHLYGTPRANVRLFPGVGPTLHSSFYAETLPETQRLFVGIIPHNKTLFNAMLELLEHYHSIVQDLLSLPAGSPNPYGGAISPGSNDWSELLDRYVTSLSYFLSLREVSSLRNDLNTHVSPRLEEMGKQALTLKELTGSTSTDEVAATLEFLDRSKPREERGTAVLASAMISHGVDVDRLNAMFFYGMPRQNAEYIQASSRVGRTHLGLVFVCHHPARERDQSHYASFSKYHEYVGQLVEPVAINRWATFSINRTLPGLFMGVLLQLIAHRGDASIAGRFYTLEHVRKLITSGSLKADDFIPILEKSYGVEGAMLPAQLAFRAEIRLRVQEFLDFIVQPSGTKTMVSQVLIPRPMISLRDVDEQIPISLDRSGTDWAARVARGDTQ